MGTVVKFEKVNYLKSLDQFINDMETRLEDYIKRNQSPCETDYDIIDCKIVEFKDQLKQYHLLYLIFPDDASCFKTMLTPYGWQIKQKLQEYFERLDKLYYNYWKANKYDDGMKSMFDKTDEMLKATGGKLEWF